MIKIKRYIFNKNLGQTVNQSEPTQTRSLNIYKYFEQFLRLQTPIRERHKTPRTSVHAKTVVIWIWNFLTRNNFMDIYFHDCYSVTKNTSILIKERHISSTISNNHALYFISFRYFCLFDLPAPCLIIISHVGIFLTA